MSATGRISLISGMTLIVTACVAPASPSPTVATSSGLEASQTTAAPRPSQTPSPAPSASPVPLPEAGALDPGTYFLANPYVDDDPVRACDRGCADYQRMIVTLPAGWATSDRFVHKHHGEPDEMALSAWTVDGIYADPCRWQESALGPLDETHPEVHDAPGTLLTRIDGGLANQAHRGPLPRVMTVVALGGQAAVRIDLSVPVEMEISTCDNGEFRSWTEWDVDDGGNPNHASGQIDTVYIVDVDRRPLVIDASHTPATSDEDLAELEAILALMIIDR